MICLKDRLILFLLAFIATLNVGITFRVAQVVREVEEFEPVVIEKVVEVTPEPEVTPEVSPEPTPDPEPEEPEVTVEPEVVQPRINCRLDDETQQMILEMCEHFNIDFAFTMAVIFKESSFRPNADSGSSVGLMQINRSNHKWLSEELGITDFFDPMQNVTAGLHMLRLLFDRYEDPHLVLMAYNMGEGGAGKLWKQGIYSSAYSEGVLQVADKYNQEIQERMGENNVHG